MDSSPHDLSADIPTESRHEESDASIRPLAMFLAGLSTSLIVVSALVWLLFYAFLGTEEKVTASREARPLATAAATQPQLQVSPRRDLDDLRQKEDKTLGSTEWIDRNQRIARIPIDSAMEQVAAHGLPKWPPATAQAPASSKTSSDGSAERPKAAQ
jgi:hypothetical protein